MRHILFGLTILCCCGVFAPMPLPSQSAPTKEHPYVATLKRTIYLAEPGKPEVIKEIVLTTEARDSQGRIYRSAGSNIPMKDRQDLIQDGVAGRSFWVNRHDKVAYFSVLDPNSSGPKLSHPGAQSVEIRGVRCVKLSAKSVKPNGEIAPIGSTCMSAELGGLKVHEDIRVEADGETLHIVSELESFEKTEPQADWFVIPADFRLVPDEPGRCHRCKQVPEKERR